MVAIWCAYRFYVIEKFEALKNLKVGQRLVGMDRIPEPELMNGPEQALAYAQADFEQPHNQFWDCVKSYAASKAIVFVMDLFRPASQDEAKRLVEQYASDEPGMLKEDFFNSLCASFRIEEVDKQLQDSNMERLSTEIVSDRHLIVYGRL